MPTCWDREKTVKHKEGPMDPITGHAVQQPFKEEGDWVWWKHLGRSLKKTLSSQKYQGWHLV